MPAVPPQPNRPFATIEAAVAWIVANAPGLELYDGGGVGPATDPQPKLPKVTYTRWGTDRSAETGGYTNDGPTGYAVAKFLIDFWAGDLLTAATNASAARRALNGFAGTVGGVAILAAQVVDERQQPGQLVTGREKAVQRVTLDVRVTYIDP